MGKHVSLAEMSIEALSAVIAAYPWYGAARKELCVRTGVGSGEQYADAAIYVASRKKLARAIMGSRADCSDKNVSEIVKAYISETAGVPRKSSFRDPHRGRVLVIGGDYFTSSEYEAVRSREDSKLHFVPDETDSEAASELPEPDFGDDFCTETLARIYAEQGYYEQAKEIYSKLILAYPEKSAYFAALIEKLEIKN